ncbi:MAG: carbohydrate binding family 9 domain-containing protein [bacterium]|nr:carbohydrate binding family 9 domain-containing protein [bacterium]
MKKRIVMVWICIALMTLLSVPAEAATAPPMAPGLVEKAPVLDGILDDAGWQKAILFKDFKTMAPDFGLAPSEKTVVYMTYDHSNLYFAVHAYDGKPSAVKASVSNRDKIGNDDWVSIELDTFNDSQSNFLFKVNPLGIQVDGMVDQNERDDLSMDMVWYSKGKVTEDGYVVEIAIPLKSLRIPYKEKVVIGLGLRRSISRKSEVLAFPEYSPAKGSRLTQRQEIVVSGIRFKRIFEFNPAVTAGSVSERPNGEWHKDKNSNVGMTARASITPTLMAEVTYNPDFSHIESDAGQIDVNLRSALFFREKRPFFLEGRENFRFAASRAGYISPLKEVVHTRTIVDPLFGFKVNGKIADKHLISAILAVDEAGAGVEKESDPNALALILRYRYSLKKGSYVGAFVTNRSSGGYFNRMFGADGSFRLTGNSKFEFRALGSFHKEKDGLKEYNTGADLAAEYYFDSRKVELKLGVNRISKGFRIDTGHLSRSGLTRIPGDFWLTFLRGSGFLKKVRYGYVTTQTYDHEAGKWETFNYTGLQLNFPGKSWMWIGGNLRSEIYAGKRFDTSFVGLGFYGQILKQLYFDTSFEYGKRIFYDPQNPLEAKGLWLGTQLIYQPTDKLSTGLDLTYENMYRRSDGKKLYDYYILRSPNSFQFNKYLSLRAIVEFNSYYKRISGDLLASFTYIPGTVLQLGYGKVYEKRDKYNRQNIPAAEYLNTRRSFFFKASYLMRF